MKIKVRLFVPVLPEVLGRKEIEVDFVGDTIQDLIDHLHNLYGEKAKQALFDENDKLDPVIQVLLNGEEWIAHDELGTYLKDGDELVFMLLLAGG